MAGKEKQYKRLPGARLFSYSLGRSSLWLADDHLLQVLHRGYSEEYMRFYRADIQAIVLWQTETGLVLNVIFGGLLLFGLLMMALGRFRWGWEPWEFLLWAIFPVFFGVLFLLNALQGPTCKTYIVTAAHRQHVPSLNRIRVARRVFRILKSWVEAVQGPLQ